MSMRLYEIANQYQFLMNDFYDQETGEVNDKALAKLDEVKDSLENKVINITRVFKEMEANVEAIEKERKAMQERERSIKNQISRLKDYLKFNMEHCNIKKIECPQFVIALQKNPEAVKIVDESQIPATYEKFEVSLDVAKIREDLKKGIDVPGAHLVQGNSIRIR